MGFGVWGFGFWVLDFLVFFLWFVVYGLWLRLFSSFSADTAADPRGAPDAMTKDTSRFVLLNLQFIVEGLVFMN